MRKERCGWPLHSSRRRSGLSPSRRVRALPDRRRGAPRSAVRRSSFLPVPSRCCRPVTARRRTPPPLTGRRRAMGCNSPRRVRPRLPPFAPLRDRCRRRSSAARRPTRTFRPPSRPRSPCRRRTSSASPAEPPTAAVIGAAIHRRMQDLAVASFQMDRLNGDVYQFTCMMPTADAGRTHRIEARGATQAEAVRRAWMRRNGGGDRGGCHPRHLPARRRSQRPFLEFLEFPRLPLDHRHGHRRRILRHQLRHRRADPRPRPRPRRSDR